MACIFRMAAIKKEAEVYISQGLYREALSLYDKMLGRNANINPRMKRSIETTMGQIKVSMNIFETDQHDLMSNPAITRIKKGWHEGSSHADILVSAKALFELGLYRDALAEYRRLLARKCMTVEVAEGVADCLTHLVKPEQLPRAIDRLAGDIFQFPKNILMFKLLIARNLDVQCNPHHFKALCLHLQRIECVPADLQEHIRSLGRRLENKPAVDSDEDAYGPGDGLDSLYTTWTRQDR